MIHPNAERFVKHNEEVLEMAKKMLEAGEGLSLDMLVDYVANLSALFSQVLIALVNTLPLGEGFVDSYLDILKDQIKSKQVKVVRLDAVRD